MGLSAIQNYFGFIYNINRVQSLLVHSVVRLFNIIVWRSAIYLYLNQQNSSFANSLSPLSSPPGGSAHLQEPWVGRLNTENLMCSARELLKILDSFPLLGLLTN